MRTALKFGIVIDAENQNFVYLDATPQNVYLSQIINKELTRQILQRYQSLTSNQEVRRGNPAYKVVKLTTKEFEDLGAHCLNTAKDSNQYDLVNAAILGELNEIDKQALLDELLVNDGFVDKVLQELLKKYKRETTK